MSVSGKQSNGRMEQNAVLGEKKGRKKRKRKLRAAKVLQSLGAFRKLCAVLTVHFQLVINFEGKYYVP